MAWMLDDKFVMHGQHDGKALFLEAEHRVDKQFAGESLHDVFR